MIKLFLFTFFFFASIFSYSQQKYSLHASQFQAEVFGPGSLFSLNFDTRFSKKENGLGFRIGLGGSPLGTLGKSCNTGSQISLPIAINYLLGKKNHYLEFGGGISPIIISGTKLYCTVMDKSFFSDETSTYKYLLAGYRYHRTNKKGATYRAFISPLFQPGFTFKFWGGFSLGYRI